jgi:hypothetical protein
MKKTLITVLVLLMLASVSAVAQTGKDAVRPSLMNEYELWKQKELANKAELPEHLAMVVVSQRIEEGRAQLDFALINTFGDRKLGNELMLEIQPMITSRNADGKYGESLAVGSATRTFLTAADSDSLNSPSTVSVLVPADPRANTVMVKWVLSKRTADDKQALSDNTMHLFLEAAPNSTLMAITKAKSSEQ